MKTAAKIALKICVLLVSLPFWEKLKWLGGIGNVNILYCLPNPLKKVRPPRLKS